MKFGWQWINMERFVKYFKHSTIRRLKPYRRIIIIIFVVTILPYSLYNLYIESVEKDFFELHINGRDPFSISSACKIPNYDSFDSSILQFVFKWDAINCGRTQPYLTYVDSEGFIHLNRSGIQEYGYREQDYECVYSNIVRRNGTDDKIDIGAWKILRRKEKLQSPFVLVKCTLNTGRLVYETGHAYVSPPSRKQLEKQKRLHPGRPSVLIFGIDSMSRLNFIRQLPKTYEFLTKTLGATVLRGLTKVGDNTYPNMLTMLTDRIERNTEGIPSPVWRRGQGDGYYDDLPFVWKEYSKQGYITMYSEDQPKYSVFNYLKYGFRRKPTDYYMRPFWLAMDTIGNCHGCDDRCYRNVPKYVYLFNYTEEFILKMRNVNYFTFSFLSGYSHEAINAVQVIDHDFEVMLQRMYHRGDFHNTLVIVMGDHGNRYDEIRQTVIGRVEERLPFFAVYVPPLLQDQYPHLQPGLELNIDVLLSWHDVYEMLMDVAMDNLEQVSRVKRWGSIGYSPFRAVPQNRTCLQAGIPLEYCVCAREWPLAPHDPTVELMAQDLVKHINGLLEHAVGGTCSQLVILEVVGAQLLLRSWQMIQPHGFVATYRVTVRVSPSEGLLEGMLERDAWSTSARIIGDINRINKYGDQSHCVQDNILKLYCYCTDLLAVKEG